MVKAVFETPWFAIHEVPSQPEWHMGDAPFYCLVGPDNVLVIPVDDQGRVMMIRQFRPARRIFTLEFPAGAIDPGETPLAAAQREMGEETGFSAREWVPITVSGVASNRESAVCHIFAAFGLTQDESPPEAGIAEIHWLAPAELHAAVRSGGLDMVATIGALFIAKAFLGARLPDFW